MSTLPHPAAATPPVRHGRCRLLVSINEHIYKLKRLPCPVRGGKVWQLVKAGQAAAHVVAAGRGTVSCTCPDHEHRSSAWCKHIRALQALGLVSKKAVPPLFVALAGGSEKGGPR